MGRERGKGQIGRIPQKTGKILEKSGKSHKGQKGRTSPDWGGTPVRLETPPPVYLRKRQNTRKSRVQEVSRDRSRIIHPSLIAPRHNKTSVLELACPSRGELPNSENFLNPRLSGLLSFSEVNRRLRQIIADTTKTDKTVPVHRVSFWKGV